MHLPGQNLADDIFKCIMIYGFLSFRFDFHWSLFLRVKLRISEVWLGNGLAPNRRQAIIWTNTDPAYRRTYAALEGDLVREI